VVEVFNVEGHSLGSFGRLGDQVDQVRRIDAIHVDQQGHVYVIDSRQGKVVVFGEMGTAP